MVALALTVLLAAAVVALMILAVFVFGRLLDAFFGRTYKR